MNDRKLFGESMMGNSLRIILKYFFRLFINYREENRNFIIEKFFSYYFD